MFAENRNNFCRASWLALLQHLYEKNNSWDSWQAKTLEKNKNEMLKEKLKLYLRIEIIFFRRFALSMIFCPPHGLIFNVVFPASLSIFLARHAIALHLAPTVSDDAEGS